MAINLSEENFTLEMRKFDLVVLRKGPYTITQGVGGQVLPAIVADLISGRDVDWARIARLDGPNPDNAEETRTPPELAADLLAFCAIMAGPDEVADLGEISDNYCYLNLLHSLSERAQPRRYDV